MLSWLYLIVMAFSLPNRPYVFSINEDVIRLPSV